MTSRRGAGEAAGRGEAGTATPSGRSTSPADGPAESGGHRVRAFGGLRAPDGFRAPGWRHPPGWAPASRGRRAPDWLQTLGSVRAGVGAGAASIALTFTVAALGPSVMEPPLPGRPGQPPWAFGAHPSAYLVVGLTAAALVLGTFGLAVTMRAARRGWTISPRLVLLAGITAAAALALLPPFGSSDHLSYAAYGRMLATGHNPYLTGPDVLARLGDPVARAVEDWKTSPSVYGVLASGGQWLASLIGGTSVRLTVFVLSLLNLAAFTGTGLLLHAMAGERSRQLRAALLWTCNPLLLMVLVAGAHVDAQAIVFGVAAIAAFAWLVRWAGRARSAWRYVLAGAAAGAAAGLGFEVKLSMALVAIGLVVACLSGRPPRGVMPSRAAALAALGGLVAGFGAVTAAALAIGGVDSLRPALRGGSYVSIGTPWRWVRSLLQLATGEPAADNIVKAAAVTAMLALAILLLRGLPRPDAPPGSPQNTAALAGRAALAFALAWLTAGPYLLPWYDGLAWALLPLLPWSAIDWLVLALTATLAAGYLPARGIAMPGGLTWLRSVIRTGLTPALLLGIAAALVITLRSTGAANRALPDGRSD
jgi:hypothetical protein